MFSDQNMYEAKVFLRALADSQNTMKQAAEQKNHLARYENSVNSLLSAAQSGAINVNNDKVELGKHFQGLKEVKLFQFSNATFKKYFPGFDSFSGDYSAMKKYLHEGVKKMENDV